MDGGDPRKRKAGETSRKGAGKKKARASGARSGAVVLPGAAAAQQGGPVAQDHQHVVANPGGADLAALNQQAALSDSAGTRAAYSHDAADAVVAGVADGTGDISSLDTSLTLLTGLPSDWDRQRGTPPQPQPVAAEEDKVSPPQQNQSQGSTGDALAAAGHVPPGSLSDKLVSLLPPDYVRRAAAAATPADKARADARGTGSTAVSLLQKYVNVTAAQPPQQPPPAAAVARASAGHAVLTAGGLQLPPTGPPYHPLPQSTFSLCPSCGARPARIASQPMTHLCLCEECLNSRRDAVCPVCGARGGAGDA